MRSRVRWALGMTAFGVVVALAVYAVTGSVLWTLAGLFAAGVVGNIVARPVARS
jgi:outer membrane lipoprotein SlyB